MSFRHSITAAAVLAASSFATAASAATPLTVTYTGTVSGLNTTFNAPFSESVILTGITTQEDAADRSFGFSSFSANYSGNVSSLGTATGAFVNNLFRISVNGATFADFAFTGGLPNFATGTNYAVTLSGGAPISGAFGTAVINGGAGVLRGDVPAVPEPATWAMMLLGFGMVAGAARYRRRSANVIYA